MHPTQAKYLRKWREAGAEHHYITFDLAYYLKVRARQWQHLRAMKEKGLILIKPTQSTLSVRIMIC